LRNALAGETAPPPADSPAEQPINLVAEHSAADATAAATDFSSSAREFPETMAVSTTAPEAVTEAVDTSDQLRGGRDTRLPLSLALALGALLAFLLWGWFRARTRAADAV
jgi:type VI protein secretion system component VasF